MILSMNRLGSVSLFIIINFLFCFLSGCSSTKETRKETLYGDIPIANLTDEQLVREMESIYISLGRRYSRAELLMAIKPDPAYVLTSSYTTFSGSYSVNMTTYRMPYGYRGYGIGTLSGSASTQYHYSDANAFIRGIITIGQLVNESRIRRLQERGYSIVVEFRKRAEERRKDVEMEIEQFLTKNPDLKERRTLLAAILPWAASERSFQSNIEILEYAGNIARELRVAKKPSKIWYGTFSQIDRFRDGTTLAGSNFITTTTQVIGDVLTGKGILGSGEIVSLQARIKDGKWKGVVTNETGGASFECQGVITETEFTATYWGSALGRYLEGTVVLMR
jgi:hypothetical protein